MDAEHWLLLALHQQYVQDKKENQGMPVAVVLHWAGRIHHRLNTPQRQRRPERSPAVDPTELPHAYTVTSPHHQLDGDTADTEEQQQRREVLAQFTRLTRACPTLSPAQEKEQGSATVAAAQHSPAIGRLGTGGGGEEEQLHSEMHLIARTVPPSEPSARSEG